MKEIKLFDYQEDMKERIEKALRLHRSVMAQMPTGTGKTVLLASVVESFLREHSNCNVWIVAHRRVHAVITKSQFIYSISVQGRLSVYRQSLLSPFMSFFGNEKMGK